MRGHMDRKLGLLIFGGMLIGALFGLIFAGPNGNDLLGLGGGAFIGAAIGWFAAAAIMERRPKK